MSLELAVPAFTDSMRGPYNKLAPEAPVARTYRHYTDHRVFHAVYQVTTQHRGTPRVEVYGVLVSDGNDPVAQGETHDYWLPDWALNGYWFAEEPACATVGAARTGNAA